MNYQKLFDYLDKELGVIALETQLSEIKEICREMIEKESEEDFEENWFPFGELDQETPELHPSITHISTSKPLSEETLGIVNKMADMASKTPIRETLAP